MRTFTVLFVCTENSARSIMAEAILKQLSPEYIQCVSAGTHPSDVSQKAIETLKNRGIETAGLYSKAIEEIELQEFDYIITLCEKASQECRGKFAEIPHIVWDFPDPAEVNTQDAFDRTVSQLSDRIRMLLLIIEKRQKENSARDFSSVLDTPQEFFKVMADSLRLSLVLALTRKNELCVCDFVEMTGMSQPKISRHLAQLREYALVVDRRDHRWVHCRLNPAMPDWMRKVIDTTANNNPQLIPHIESANC